METQQVLKEQRSRMRRFALIAVAVMLTVTVGAVALFRSSSSARQANAVICPSEDTAEGVARHYGIDRDKIEVIPLAAAQVFFSSSNGKPGSPSLQPRYVLSLVSLSLHKNIEGLVHGFAQARASYSLPHELRIVGMRGIIDVRHQIHDGERGDDGGNC